MVFRFASIQGYLFNVVELEGSHGLKTHLT